MMGGSSYSRATYSDSLRKRGYASDDDYASSYKKLGTSLNELVDPYNRIRESRDTDTVIKKPVILGLDMTGSMGKVTQEILNAIPKILESVSKADPGLEFMVVGFDDLWVMSKGAIQATQFERDHVVQEYLEKFWLTGMGGGNMSESYSAVYYFALHHAALDWIDLHHGKGLIITMGDEQLDDEINAQTLHDCLGLERQIKNPGGKELLRQAQEKFAVYHINIGQSANSYSHGNREVWEPLLGENYFPKTGLDQLGERIISICLKHYGTTTGESVSEKKESPGTDYPSISW
jgi:hypothetical protein